MMGISEGEGGEKGTEGIFEGQITVRHQSTDPGRTENTKQHT